MCVYLLNTCVFCFGYIMMYCSFIFKNISDLSFAPPCFLTNVQAKHLWTWRLWYLSNIETREWSSECHSCNPMCTLVVTRWLWSVGICTKERETPDLQHLGQPAWSFRFEDIVLVWYIGCLCFVGNSRPGKKQGWKILGKFGRSTWIDIQDLEMFRCTTWELLGGWLLWTKTHQELLVCSWNVVHGEKIDGICWHGKTLAGNALCFFVFV